MDDPTIQKYFERLDEFKARFSDELQSGEFAEFLDDAMFKRFLCARQGDLKKSEAMLRDCLAWRREQHPERLCYDNLHESLKWGKMYLHGHDKFGRPLLVSHKMLPHPDAPNTISLEMALYNVEKALQYMKHTGATQLVWLANLNGYTRGNSPPVSHTIGILKTLMNNYPEILGAAVLVDAPRIFSWLWSAISLVIDKRTASKVHFVKGTPEQKMQALSRWFTPDQLEPVFGGTKDFHYDLEAVDGPGARERMFAETDAEQAALRTAAAVHEVPTDDLAGVDSLGEPSGAADDDAEN